jgi:SP family sugar:H+ symporter-like MFS transporter
MGLFSRKDRSAEHSNASTAVPSNANSMDLPTAPAAGGNGFVAPKPVTGEAAHDYPVLTLRTAFMAILVAMGGFIFGYDTGQISGFLEMDVFLRYFGQLGPITQDHPTGYYFTNVRSGLIVGLVSVFIPIYLSIC